MSESPALECLPLCEKSDCYAYRAPDSAFQDRLVFDVQARYEQVKLPIDFHSFASYNAPSVVREVLTKIVPNTPLEVAIEYLNLASYLWFINRAYEGIVKSSSKDLILPFEDTLSGNGLRHVDQLENLLNDIRTLTISGTQVEILANRTKAIFSLLMAIKVMEKR